MPSSSSSSASTVNESAAPRGFGTTVELRLRPSLRALRLIFVLHVIGLVLLPFAMQPGGPMLALVAAFGLSWFWLRHSAVLGFGPRAITRLVWHADGGWSVFRGGREAKAELLGSSLVQSYLLILNFRLADGRRAARLIDGGEAEAEPLRRLRARLSLHD